MGYQDREYMRGEGSGGAGRSNPLWWILGLIALILVVAFFRRGTMPDGTSQAGQQVLSVTGPTQTCRIQLVAGPEPPARLLPVLREFFHQQGYDSTIHETADGTVASAGFARESPGGSLSEHAIYQRIAASSGPLKPQHMLIFHVYRAGAEVGDAGDLQRSQEVSRLLRLRLEAEFPGIVANIDDTPRPFAYDDYE